MRYAAALLLGWLAAAFSLHAEDAAKPLVARTNQPLDLLLTQAELRSVIRRYEERTGENLTAPLDDEVLVTAPGERAPMRDVAQDVPMGIVAPFWAIANPTQAWRIFVPIPPKGLPQDQRPMPDPR